MDYEGRHIWEIGEPVYFMDPDDCKHKIILRRGVLVSIKQHELKVEDACHYGRSIPTEHCYSTANALFKAMKDNLQEEYDKLMAPILNKKGKKSGRSE